MKPTPNHEEIRTVISQLSSMQNRLQCESENILRLKDFIGETFEGIQSEEIIACMQRMEIAAHDIRRYSFFFDKMTELFQYMDDVYGPPGPQALYGSPNFN